ncbi:MAG: PAS domain-containing protein [Actinobacteria bacterium]|nr:PAS domain-containing protein [Actinomycetota bacterium]
MTPPEGTLDHDAIRRLAELSSDREDLIVSVVEPDECRIVWCSEAGLRHIVDREPTEIVGRSPSTVLAPHDEHAWRRTVRDTATGETVQLDREVERPDGRRIRLSSTAWRVDGRDGPVVALSVRHPEERRGRRPT